MKKKHTFTAAMDEEITRCYQQQFSCPGSAPVADCAEHLRIPRSTVTARAVRLGVIPVSRSAPIWTDEELTILEHHGHKSTAAIQYQLKKKGFQRSLSGIYRQLKRSHILKNLKGQSATSLALCFGVHTHTVIQWITKGLLKAKRRGTNRTAAQGGDAWFITDRQVREFIINSVSVVDFRKVDKFWLVDLLAGGDVGVGPLVDDIHTGQRSNGGGGTEVYDYATAGGGALWGGDGVSGPGRYIEEYM